MADFQSADGGSIPLTRSEKNAEVIQFGRILHCQCRSRQFDSALPLNRSDTQCWLWGRSAKLVQHPFNSDSDLKKKECGAIGWRRMLISSRLRVRSSPLLQKKYRSIAQVVQSVSLTTRRPGVQTSLLLQIFLKRIQWKQQKKIRSTEEKYPSVA